MRKRNTVFHIPSFKRKENPHLLCWPISNWMLGAKHQVHSIQKNWDNLPLGEKKEIEKVPKFDQILTSAKKKPPHQTKKTIVSSFTLILL